MYWLKETSSLLKGNALVSLSFVDRTFCILSIDTLFVVVMLHLYSFFFAKFLYMTYLIFLKQDIQCK